MVAADTLFKIDIKTFEKLSKAVWSPPSSPPTSTLNTLPDYTSVSRYTQLNDVNRLVFSCLTFPSFHCRATQGEILSSRALRSSTNLPGHHMDMHITVVDSEDYMDRVEQHIFNISTKREERDGRRKNNHVRLQPRVFWFCFQSSTMLQVSQYV